jgi:uncharacterized protein
MKQVQLTTYDGLANIVLLFGAINWGLVGLFNFNIIEFLLGSGSILSRLVYCLIGMSALYVLYTMTQKGDILEPQMV